MVKKTKTLHDKLKIILNNPELFLVMIVVLVLGFGALSIVYFSFF